MSLTIDGNGNLIDIDTYNAEVNRRNALKLQAAQQEEQERVIERRCTSNFNTGLCLGTLLGACTIVAISSFIKGHTPTTIDNAANVSATSKFTTAKKLAQQEIERLEQQLSKLKAAEAAQKQ